MALRQHSRAWQDTERSPQKVRLLLLLLLLLTTTSDRHSTYGTYASKRGEPRAEPTSPAKESRGPNGVSPGAAAWSLECRREAAKAPPPHPFVATTMLPQLYCFLEPAESLSEVVVVVSGRVVGVGHRAALPTSAPINPSKTR